jgi:hypothetical protein
VGKVATRSLDKADETRRFPNGTAEMVTLEGVMIGRARFDPGWRWSSDVKPIAGTERCMILHKGYVISGAMVVQAEDGTETTINAGDAYVIEPGHDAWVLGGDPWVAIDFSEQMADYAKPKE